MKIVNVRGLPANSPGIIYCGRDCNGWDRSPLANPEVLRHERDRDAAVERYRAWLWDALASDDRTIREALLSLPEDAVLGCWCAPKRCHCEVIIEAAAKLRLG